MKCPQCGAEIEEADARFCEMCGAAVPASNAAPDQSADAEGPAEDPGAPRGGSGISPLGITLPHRLSSR